MEKQRLGELAAVFSCLRGAADKTEPAFSVTQQMDERQ